MALTGYKVYVVENYFYMDEIVDSGSAKRFEALAKDVLVRTLNVDSTSYAFTGVNGAPTTEIPFSMIKDLNGDAYADQATFETFYREQTGKSSGGDTPGGGITIQDVLNYLADPDNDPVIFGMDVSLNGQGSNSISGTLYTGNVDVQGDAEFEGEVEGISSNRINEATILPDRLQNFYTYNDGSMSKPIDVPLADWIGKHLSVTNASALIDLVLTSDGVADFFENGVLAAFTTISAGQTKTFYNNGEIIITN